MSYQSINPYTAQTVKTFTQISDTVLEQHLSVASACFQLNWRFTGFAQRKTVLKRAAQLMRERADEMAELITLEMGKLIAQSQGEVALSAAILDYYADHAEAFLASETLTTAKGEAMVVSDPIGVLFGVEP
jgi:succinate-semialdehyde dehydrogenase / glutarate-semialdehyde dehydrogenase